MVWHVFLFKLEWKKNTFKKNEIYLKMHNLKNNKNSIQFKQFKLNIILFKDQLNVCFL